MQRAKGSLGPSGPAAQTGGQEADALTSAARQAFVDGWASSMWMGAAAMAGIFVLEQAITLTRTERAYRATAGTLNEAPSLTVTPSEAPASSCSSAVDERSRDSRGAPMTA